MEYCHIMIWKIISIFKILLKYHKVIHGSIRCDSVTFIKMKKMKISILIKYCNTENNNIIRYVGLSFYRENVCVSTDTNMSKVLDFV